jgi:hypothetical protein
MFTLEKEIITPQNYNNLLFGDKIIKKEICKHEHYYHVTIGMYFNCIDSVRFRVLSVARMKMTTFWDITQCSLVEVD